MLKVRNLMSLNFTHPDIIPAHQAGEFMCTFVFDCMVSGPKCW